MAKKRKPVQPIVLDEATAVKALEEHKSNVFGLIDNPMFRNFWVQSGGTLESLDSGKEELKKWKIK